MNPKLLAVVWKNLLLRRNHWLATIWEFVIPLSIMLVLNAWVPKDVLFNGEVSNDPIIQPYGSNFYDNCNHVGASFLTELRYRDKIYYTPNNTWINKIMEGVSVRCGYKLSHLKGGPAEMLLDDSYTYKIVFTDWQTNLDYTIYPSKGDWYYVNTMWYPEGSNGGTVRRDLVEDMRDLQRAIDETYISSKSNLTLPCVSLKPMDNLNLAGSVYMIFVIMAIFFIYSILVPITITRIIEEKQSGAKELMLMMGLKSIDTWMAKFIDSVLMVFLIVSGMVFFLYIPMTETSAVVHHINPVIFWFVLMFGMIAVICFVFFLSCCFDSATFAALFTVLIGFVSASLFGVLQSSNISKWSRLCYCLLPHMCLVHGTQVLLTFEHFGKKLNWSEKVAFSPNALTLFEIFGMMIVNIILYSTLTWYLDKIRPGKFGIPLPLDFLFRKSFWFDNKVKDDGRVLMVNGSGTFENDKLGIFVHHLCKEYYRVGSQSILAVNDISLEVPKGEITTLLGHNGAGKSTTMSIITGLIPATSGSVFINGCDIRVNPKLARKSLGLCPQQDLLIPDLTSIQILTYFGMIKGMTWKNAITEGKELLVSLKMESAENKFSQHLSGGMKRKLSLGIALIGGSSVLVLDEPTSGVDPELRREICDILLSFRGKRTILLTTHIMEEADAISDRIAIMDHGKIKCVGSPMDLKLRFGAGYVLSVVMADEGYTTDIVKSVKHLIPGSIFKSRNVSTLNFQLPESETAKYQFLFPVLDTAKNLSKIHSYSLAISTLEDVFLRIQEKDPNVNKSYDQVDSSPYKVLSSRLELDENLIPKWELYLRQFAALSSKKFIQLKRSKFQLMIFSVIPLLLIGFSTIFPLLMKTYSTEQSSMKIMDYSVNPYKNAKVFYSLFSCNTTLSSCETIKNIYHSFGSICKEHGFIPKISTNLTSDLLKEYNENFHTYIREIPLAFAFEMEKITVYYSKESVHIQNIAVNLLHNAYSIAFGLNATIHALVNGINAKPMDQKELLQIAGESRSLLKNEIFKQLPGVSGLFSLYFMNAILEEIRFGAKALQLMATSSWLYWLSHFIFDLTIFLVFMWIVVILFVFQHGSVLLLENIEYVIPGTVLWCSSLLMFTYLLTFFTKSKANAICIGLTTYFIFSFFIPEGIDFLPHWLVYLHPTAIWKDGLQQIDDCCYLWILVFYCITVFVMLLIVDSNLPSRLIHKLMNVCQVNYGKPKAGIDVEKEEVLVNDLISQDGSSDDVMLVQSLRRWYYTGKNPFRRRTVAVRGVSFSLRPGECFGLLGVNGAGKSTTFNMLTGQISCSEGDAVLNQAHLSSLLRRQKYLSYIAYCPQTSGIIPTLTGEELLSFFAKLRGYDNRELENGVKKWLSLLELKDYANNQCGQYSGGMERKLSAAIAFIWNADVVLLDEPTSGVDPTSRRHIWKGIVETQTNGRSLILTSHSMEECEALCSRVAIMVNGAFRVIGEPVTLKAKLGGGYSVQIKLASDCSQNFEVILKNMKESFPSGCILTDKQCNLLHFHVSDNDTPWQKLFEKLEGMKNRFFEFFESYVASETSLEEVFLHFAGRRGPMELAEIV